MLALDSSRWSELQHAYGPATDIPQLLRQLATLPESEGQKEPWFSLWSALAHQGDVYSASFAAVPHIVSALSSAPQRASFVYFQFPAWVEICRQKAGISVPPDLDLAYRSALEQLPGLAAAAATREWNADFLACALAAIAAAKGSGDVAEAVMELSPEVSAEFLAWFHAR
jgi:hypothetical protein